MFRIRSVLTVSSGSSTSNFSSSTSLASSAFVDTYTTSSFAHFYSKYIMLHEFDFFFWWLLRFIFFAITCYEDERVTILYFFLLLSVYFQYLIVQLSCYDDVLCVSWTISITQFTELVRKFSNAQFSVNILLKLVILIILRLRFIEVVCNRFSERDSLSSIKIFIQSIR